MIELFGMQLGTLFQGGTMAAMFAVLAIVGRAWIVGIPERLRVANEGKTIATTELAERYSAWRVEVHGLKNELQAVAGEQARCNKALAESHTDNRLLLSERGTMLFVIRQLIRDLERTAPDSIILEQAKATLEQLGHEGPDFSKSAPLAAAEHTVDAAKAAVEEVKQSENGGDSK